MKITKPSNDFEPFIDDEDIINAYEWITSFMSEARWKKRIRDIENQLKLPIKYKNGNPEIHKGTLAVINQDKIGWYMYLIYVGIYESPKYDYFPSSRVLPIFKRIGMDLEIVKSLNGIDKKIKRLINKTPNEADATLFEILTALIWARNGWRVSFIEEGKGGKSPDLLAIKGGVTYYIECKRQTKTADYTYKETEKRQRMISMVADLLMQHDVLLDITFHVELVSLPDEYLKTLLQDLIPNAKTPGSLVQNNEVDIKISFINYEKIDKYFKEHKCVKNNSPHLINLIAQKDIDTTSFTSGCFGKTVFVKCGETCEIVNNQYFLNIQKAYGVECRCDARKAIKAKARGISSQLSSAIKQLSGVDNKVIHVGVDTFDGGLVEEFRKLRIEDTINSTNGEDVSFIYLHFFQSYSRADCPWYMDETVERFASIKKGGNKEEPLSYYFLLLPEEEPIYNGPHWGRLAP